jgi:hypothetical protein
VDVEDAAARRVRHAVEIAADNRADCEAGLHQPCRATLDVVRRAFEAAGVEFIDENGGLPAGE